MARKHSGGWLGTLLTVGSFLFLAWMERKRPLRANVEPKLRREGRNLAVVGAAAAAIQLAGAPVVRPLTRLVERRRWGLLTRVAESSAP